ncbi:uncharacterized protein LOC129881654 [Solanum dulcamara]|uniref:uncharacterized protein LOC129881654 n=1 Tax=Solanum dulcamara TaxID=45834 RepID=UPI002484FA52|nr:uncharacterized protein LOC129881654 [Solanum dulcamara]
MEKKMGDHLCLSNTSRLLISELTLLCYFILSHPLYLSYFVFFFPYLVKILSFLSPLFITTSLLLFALVNNTISPASFISSPHSDNVSSILLSFKNALLEADGKIDELDRFEDFEVYKIVFQENPVELFDYTSPEGSEKQVVDSSVQEKDTATATVDLENSGVAVEELLKEVDEFESKTWTDNVETKKIEALGTKVEKVVEKQQEEEMIMGNGSKEADKVKKAHSWSNLDQNLGSYGSMRKEKEWTRTLACKLYEERHNASSGEGMDLLWETYEIDSGKSKVKRDNTTKKKKKGESKSKSYKKDEEVEEEEEDMKEQLCCLQALKFSAGKINLGMGRPNLVKISKAIRGFGWLHHDTKKNKVHCGDRF